MPTLRAPHQARHCLQSLVPCLTAQCPTPRLLPLVPPSPPVVVSAAFLGLAVGFWFLGFGHSPDAGLWSPVKACARDTG